MQYDMCSSTLSCSTEHLCYTGCAQLTNNRGCTLHEQALCWMGPVEDTITQIERSLFRNATPGHATPRHATPGQARPGQARPGQARPRQARPRHATSGHARSRHARPRRPRSRLLNQNLWPTHVIVFHVCWTTSYWQVIDKWQPKTTYWISQLNN